MTNDNDLLLLASSQNNKTFEVYIDSAGKKTLTPQTSNREAKREKPYCLRGTAYGLLAGKDPKKVVFPNCSEASGADDEGAFYEAFYKCTSLTSVSFPVLTTATGGLSSSDVNFCDGAFERAFYGCTSLTSVSFPVLTTAAGAKMGSNVSSFCHGAFDNAFENCTSLTSVSFPSLTTVTGGNSSGAFKRAFYGCTSLTSVSFPVLTTAAITITSLCGAFDNAFENCTSLTSVSFPSLTTVTGYGGRSSFYDTFRNCSSSLKVHFKKSMKENTGLYYGTLGLTSADQVVFDLP